MPRFSTLLPAVLLLGGSLLGVSSCTGKNDPQPQPQPATASASYTLDGQARTCQATQATSSGSGYDFLAITLTPTQQPSSGPEKLVINLRKPTGQATSTYEYVPTVSIWLYLDGNSQPRPVLHRSALPTFSSGTVSGSFEGEVLAMVSSGTATVINTVKAGTYANVKL